MVLKDIVATLGKPHPVAIRRGYGRESVTATDASIRRPDTTRVRMQIHCAIVRTRS
jgi:hypothetical protein